MVLKLYKDEIQVKREKQRYIVFEIILNDHVITKNDIINTVWRQFTTLFGEYGSSKAGLWLIHYDPVLKKGVLRCSLHSVNHVRASLVTLRYIRKKNGNQELKIPVIFQILGIAGTILSVKRKYFFVPPQDNKAK
ncbi:MAG: Rpp14/Pop5 family protein [Candidatus Helarchaeota archaeon]